MAPEQRFDGIGNHLTRAHEAVAAGKVFGVRCIKANGRLFAAFLDDVRVFKLRATQHAEALTLPGATMFDPASHGRPKRKRVIVPADFAERLERLVEVALREIGASR